MRATIGFLVTMLTLGLAFGALERTFGSGARRTRWRTDLAWLVAGRLLDPVVKLTIALVVACWVLPLGLPLDETLREGRGVAAALPSGVQLAVVLLVTDFLGYWSHRWHHSTDLWRIHRVHHSAEHVDWLAAVRVHPLNEVLQRVPPAIVLVVLGFDLRVVAGVAPALTLYALLLHADVPWRFGPLRYVVASPAFHRWHHACPTPGAPLGCNFAGLLPVWDLLFGTFCLPDAAPTRFGIDGRLPESFWPQLLRPGHDAPVAPERAAQ